MVNVDRYQPRSQVQTCAIRMASFAERFYQARHRGAGSRMERRPPVLRRSRPPGLRSSAPRARSPARPRSLRRLDVGRSMRHRVEEDVDAEGVAARTEGVEVTGVL